MSTILFGGNTYAEAAVYSTYVEYKVDDTTLNPFNYITIYAALPSGPAQADWTEVGILPQNQTSISLQIAADVAPVGSEAPEPGYSFALFVALAVGACYQRWRRRARYRDLIGGCAT